MFSYFWVWRMSINAAKQTFLTFCFVCLLYDLLSFLFHCRLCILESTLLGLKDLLFILLGFPRHASLRDRFWTMRNSRFPKFADQNHIRSSYFFLPKFTLESISYSPVFLRLLEEFCLTDTLCRETGQRVLALTFKVKSFLEIFSSERICVQSCNKVQNSVLSLQYQYNWICFCLRCVGFSPIHHPPLIFLLGGVSFKNINLGHKEWFFSQARKLNSRLNMVTINEVWLNRPKLFPIFCVVFLFFRSKLFPTDVRFSAEILSPYGGFPSQSGFLEFVVSSW